MRRRPELARPTLLAVVGVAAAALILVGTVQGAGESVAGAAGRAWQSIFGERPHADLGERMIVLLSSPPLADRIEAASSPPGRAEQRRWAADIEAEQQLLIGSLRERGIVIRRDETFTRTLNGFSALLDARAIAELDRNPAVVGLYPVRAVYPAETEARQGAGSGTSPEVSLPGFDGRGATIALLDTGVDRTHPSLQGRVLRGFDVVAHDLRAAPEPDPRDPARLEAHGTRMAGLIAAVAPGAKILPVRVLGWRQTSDGGTAVIGRGDHLIAGLERAVDPNGDGAVDDAVTIALAPVVEPFAAFTDSPEARAVAGASALGTLVVAPAGNDGSSGIGFGSIGAPGGATDALTVGAADTRQQVLQARARVDSAGGTLFDGAARVLGSTGVRLEQALQVTGLFGPSLAQTSRATSAEAGGSEIGDFFDVQGVSRVAGKAALVPADGTSLATKARNAKAAGASALLVYGTEVPAGALDLDDSSALPVLALPGDAGAEAANALRSGSTVTATLAPAGRAHNEDLDRIAAFSSGGLAFDARVKPDVVAPGVGLATVDPGRGAGGAPRYATVSGSSAAAAVAAGAAALVAEARKDLSATDLRSLLVGSANPLGGDQPVTREGAGAVDPASASTAELAVEPATVSFGRAGGANWSATRLLTVKNVSSRPLEVGLGLVPDSPGSSAVAFTAEPAHLSLGPGASAQIQLGIKATAGIGDGVSGVLVASAPGARPARVPWAVATRPAQGAKLVDSVSLSHWEFKPSKSAPVVLAFRAGRIVAEPGGERIEPVGLLDVELWTANGKRLGVIARLRDLLPGRYAFGLTGRDAEGKVLPAGTYVLRLRAQPVDAADGTTPSTAETVFRITN
ncbi:MAG: S8 family serine peptidase [Gaiellaceae bacterium]